MTPKAWLKHPMLNGWPLLGVILLPISMGLLFAMGRVDTGTGAGVSTMIGWSVRCAVPWLYLAFAASALQVLRPGAYSLWLLRNRKIFGLAFAGAMGWQAFFILWLVFGHTQYYVDEVYVVRDAIEGVIGYSFLLAMTVSSFMPVRKRMRPKHWKRLHTIGIYSLWIYAYSVYWWAHTYYADPDLVDHLYYWLGFAAWALRALAWRKKRWQRARQRDRSLTVSPPAWAAGVMLVLVGLAAVSTGPLWQAGSEAVFYGYGATRWAELYLPYWPFEPFLPLALIGAGLWFTSLSVPHRPTARVGSP